MNINKKEIYVRQYYPDVKLHSSNNLQNLQLNNISTNNKVINDRSRTYINNGNIFKLKSYSNVRKKLLTGEKIMEINEINEINKSKMNANINKNNTRINITTNDIFQNTINNIFQNRNNKNGKTIIHFLNKNTNFGFGDFIRGSIVLAQLANKHNINFEIDISHHPISNYINNKTMPLNIENNVDFLFNGIFKNDLQLFVENFVNSNQENISITTNYFYDKNSVNEDIKKYLNNCFRFKDEYYDKVKMLLNMDKYNVLHIRCIDEYFNKDFISTRSNVQNYKLDKLLMNISNLHLELNTIVISNNYSIKQKIGKLFGFHYIDNQAVHTANIHDITALESTIIDYIILSNSSYTHCFSYYAHGSGFSEQCSILNNVPYNVKYLHDEYNNPSNNIAIQPNLQETNYNNIAFITLTNSGYINYTFNCLESLKQIKSKIELQCYCIGIDGYNKLKQQHFQCNLIDDNENSNFQTFRSGNWSNITYYKFQIIYENLLNHEYVCFTDGDIVYENNIFFDYLLENINDNDMLIQSEGLNIDDLCSGFMFIKSNPNTISIFNPMNVEMYKNNKGWDDQLHINEIKDKLIYQKLPLYIFPTGKYYYERSNYIKPYIIHFNWIIGDEKKDKMIYYKKWYI